MLILILPDPIYNPEDDAPGTVSPENGADIPLSEHIGHATLCELRSGRDTWAGGWYAWSTCAFGRLSERGSGFTRYVKYIFGFRNHCPLASSAFAKILQDCKCRRGCGMVAFATLIIRCLDPLFGEADSAILEVSCTIRSWEMR